MSSKKITQEVPAEEPKPTPARTIKWIPILSWGVTALLLASLVLVLFKINPFEKEEAAAPETNTQVQVELPLPEYQSTTTNYSVVRLADLTPGFRMAYVNIPSSTQSKKAIPFSRLRNSLTLNRNPSFGQITTYSTMIRHSFLPAGA